MYRHIHLFFYVTFSLLLLLNGESKSKSSERIEEISKSVQTIQWPDERYESIQSAIDALEDGGKLEIGPGAFELTEPLIVSGKYIIIEGSPSGRDISFPKMEEDGFCVPNLQENLETRLIGPRPSSLVKDEEARGVINFINAGGVLKNLELSGFDAGVISRNGKGEESNLMMNNVIIKETGRGILFDSTSSLTIGYCLVEDVLGNGVSYNPSEYLDALNSFIAYNSIVKDGEKIGIEINNTFDSSISNMMLGGFKGGGIVGRKSHFNVYGCIIGDNHTVGIAYIESYGYVVGNYIYNTYKRVSDNAYGDGVAVLLRGISQPGNEEKPVKVFNNWLFDNERAGLTNLGGHVITAANHIKCNSINIIGDPFLGKEFLFDAIGNDICYDCTDTEIDCVYASAGLGPPGDL